MSALAEAIETATRETTRAPQSNRAIETTDSMIRQLDEILASIDLLTPEQLAVLPEDLRAGLLAAVDKIQGMLVVAVNIERLGGSTPWRQPLGDALGRLKRTLERIGLEPPFMMAKPVPEAAPALIAKLRAFLAGAAPARLNAATLEGIALVADMVDQQHDFVGNFLKLNATLGHEGDDWFREMRDLLSQIEDRREDLWGLLDIALADAALAESEERVSLERVLRELGI